LGIIGRRLDRPRPVDELAIINPPAFIHGSRRRRQNLSPTLSLSRIGRPIVWLHSTTGKPALPLSLLRPRRSSDTSPSACSSAGEGKLAAVRWPAGAGRPPEAMRNPSVRAHPRQQLPCIAHSARSLRALGLRGILPLFQAYGAHIARIHGEWAAEPLEDLFKAVSSVAAYPNARWRPPQLPSSTGEDGDSAVGQQHLI
jgi:hypothetical protein